MTYCIYMDMYVYVWSIHICQLLRPQYASDKVYGGSSNRVFTHMPKFEKKGTSKYPSLYGIGV